MQRWEVASKSRALRLAAAGIAVIAAGVFLAFLYLDWPFTADDAFIWFRYAQNLSEGYGPTFNPGKPPVEGYTGLFWLLVMAIPHLLALDVVLFSKIVGVGMTLGTIGVTWRFASRLCEFAGGGVQLVAAASAVFVLAASRHCATHAVSGMETAAYSFFLQLFLYGLMAAKEKPESRWLAFLPLVALFVGITRPEGNLAVGVGLGGLLLQLRGRERRRLATAALFAFAIPAAAYFCWRLLYYGVLFPLPFYLDLAGGLGGSLPGTEVIPAFFADLTLPMGLLLVLGLPRAARRIPLSLACVVSLLIFFTFRIHRMGYGYRYLYPVLPLLCVIFASGFAGALDMLRTRINVARRKDLAAAIGAIVLIAVVSLGIVAHIRSLGGSRYLRVVRFYATVLESAHVALGKRLHALREVGRAPVLAIADAGAVPYYSKWETIDTFGLNDAHIALTGRHDAEYVLSRRPDLVVLLSRDRQSFDPMMPWAQELYEKCLEVGMERLAVLGMSGYFLWAMARPDGPVAAQLRRPFSNESRRADGSQ